MTFRLVERYADYLEDAVLAHMRLDFVATRPDNIVIIDNIGLTS